MGDLKSHLSDPSFHAQIADSCMPTQPRRFNVPPKIMIHESSLIVLYRKLSSPKHTEISPSTRHATLGLGVSRKRKMIPHSCHSDTNDFRLDSGDTQEKQEMRMIWWCVLSRFLPEEREGNVLDKKRGIKGVKSRDRALASL